MQKLKKTFLPSTTTNKKETEFEHFCNIFQPKESK